MITQMMKRTMKRMMKVVMTVVAVNKTVMAAVTVMVKRPRLSPALRCRSVKRRSKALTTQPTSGASTSAASQKTTLQQEVLVTADVVHCAG